MDRDERGVLIPTPAGWLLSVGGGEGFAPSNANAASPQEVPTNGTVSDGPGPEEAGPVMKLYYHQTDGGAEYLFDTFIECEHNGEIHREGVINDQTKYIVRIDGNITKDAELTVRAE